MTNGTHLSPFDLGRKAGSDPSQAAINPFKGGTAEYNNFEVGRRFGAAKAETDFRDRLGPDDMKPDPDETDESDDAS
jgi:hypothetical protein